MKKWIISAAVVMMLSAFSLPVFATAKHHGSFAQHQTDLCTNNCTVFADENKDGICNGVCKVCIDENNDDICSHLRKNYVDENKDGICDNRSTCSSDQRNCRKFSTDSDNVCGNAISSGSHHKQHGHRRR